MSIRSAANGSYLENGEHALQDFVELQKERLQRYSRNRKLSIDSRRRLRNRSNSPEGAAPERAGDAQPDPSDEDPAGRRSEWPVTGAGIHSDWNRPIYLSTGSTPQVSVQPRTFKALARRVVQHLIFKVFISVVILANSVTIGWEQNLTLRGADTTAVDALEHVFLVIYIAELYLKFVAYGPGFIRDMWTKFDIFLVTLGVVTEWLLKIPWCGGYLCESEQLGFIMVLRCTRLLRLARTARLLIRLKELWMLVRGLMDSASTMFYTLVMTGIVLFMFSTIGIELITKHRFADPNGPEYDDEFAEHVKLFFADLPRTMLTLLQFSTLDSVSAVYVPLVTKDPFLVGYFLGIMLVVSIVLMNLITAVVVNSALDRAMQDKELMKIDMENMRKTMVRDLKRMYMRLDEDGSGEISLDEIMLMQEEDRLDLEAIMALADPVDIFRMLDVDNSGHISIDEFIDGVWQVASEKGNITMKRIERKVDSMRKHISDHERFQVRMEEALVKVAEACNRLHSAHGPVTSGCKTWKNGGGNHLSLKAAECSLETAQAVQPLPHAASAQATESAEIAKSIFKEIQELVAAEVESRKLLGALHTESASVSASHSKSRRRTREERGGEQLDTQKPAVCRHSPKSDADIVCAVKMSDDVRAGAKDCNTPSSVEVVLMHTAEQSDSVPFAGETTLKNFSAGLLIPRPGLMRGHAVAAPATVPPHSQD